MSRVLIARGMFDLKDNADSKRSFGGWKQLIGLHKLVMCEGCGLQ